MHRVFLSYVYPYTRQTRPVTIIPKTLPWGISLVVLWSGPVSKPYYTGIDDSNPFSRNRGYCFT